MVCTLHGYYDARPKMCYSPSPPPPNPEAIFSSNLTFGYKCSSDYLSAHNTNYHYQDYNSKDIIFTKEQDNMQRLEDIQNVNDSKIDEETTSDYKQWLHAMKLVARLPGGIPPEFRRKLWLSLADKYLKSKNVIWEKEEEKCFCEKWREDDEELGIQIVKDLHRTGSTLCTGPAGDLNQAKLKRILLGYARYNPEVGYCQGFNMLGALILQVMDKDESESIKVMIYLVEGILPTGYFCGSMGGLQADMAVFRELMQTKLPRLAKHLQKLQGPIENAYEPPLTNVFTMQWFLTMFCTCLPMSCVLRVWDLVLIEGSDVLLRTALALWSLLEERVLGARSADDFYGKMGSFSGELLNGHLIDSNGLIEKVVQLGPIVDIQKLRNKHLCSIAPIERQQGLQLYFDDDEPDIDEDSRLAVATVWGIPWGRRGSQGQSNNNVAKQAIENKDRIALDISLLKKQYDKLRERQKQAQIILTTACSTASRQSATTAPLPVNQLLSGRPAIVTNKGRRSGPPTGAIPPARKPSLPAVLHDKPLDVELKRGETLHWRDTKYTKNRRDSLSWKEIKAERAALITSGSIDGLKSQKLRSGRVGKSDSSSYSEESDENEAAGGEDASSTDTSLCDDDLQPLANDKKHRVHTENNLKPSSKKLYKSKKTTTHKQRQQSTNLKGIREKTRPKSWAPSNSEIPFILMTTDSANNSADENTELVNLKTTDNNILNDEKDNLVEKTSLDQNEISTWKTKIFSPIPDELVAPNIEERPLDKLESNSNKESISFLSTTIGGSSGTVDQILTETFDISSEGVTNEYFERVNSTERPTKLELLYSLNEDENVRDVFEIGDNIIDKSNVASELYANDKKINSSNNIRCMDLLVDYSEKSSVACIEEAKTEISTFQSVETSASVALEKEYACFTNENTSIIKKPKSIAEKRRDPRRLTLTRSSTMDIEKRFEMFEKRLSMEAYSNYKTFSEEIQLKTDYDKASHQTDTVYSDPSNHESGHTKLSAQSVLPDKKIPSTADLEERFKNIQQQLVRDRNRMIKSPCDSENNEKQPNINTSSENNIKRSSQSNKINKQAKEGKDDEENNEKVEGENTMTARSDIEERSSTSIEVGDINGASGTKDTHSATVHARQSISSETKQLQSKKEPPDESRDDEDIVEKNNLCKNSAPETETNKKSSDSEELTDDHKKNIQTLNSETVEEKGASVENPKGSRRSSDRTSPPSTAELEKRFCALEDQMSSAKAESNETQNKSKETSDKMGKEDVKDFKSHNESISKTDIDSSQVEADVSNIIVSAHVKTSLTKFEQISENNTKRRLSEPPSTEDLEKRYEVLKRRMSSRNFETRTIHNDELSIELQQQPNKSTDSSANTSSKNLPPSIENLEERYKKLQNKIESKSAITHSPPSTKNLEERFEKLQTKNEPNCASITKSPPSTENLEERFEKLQNENDRFETKKSNNDVIKTTSGVKKQDQKSNENNTNLESDKNSLATEDLIDLTSTSNDGKISDDDEVLSSQECNTIVMIPQDEVQDMSEKKRTANVLAKNANKIKIKLIEELQSKLKDNSINTNVDGRIDRKTMLIEELKTKIDPSSDKGLKPTQISSRRQPPSQSTLLPSLSFNDETLESHATSAYCKSEKYEPMNATKRKMVRRFSDLPSRADLENRLQFLEEQLSKTLCMQRRSGDSEVTSKARLNDKAAIANIPLSGSLEYRVQELEKRFNDNRTFSMDVECSNVNESSDPDIDISQVELATDTAAVTGKELVRYSSHGEIGDNEHQNPINISINIQMTLNKDDVISKKRTDVCKTDDLDRRLQFLEQQLKTKQGHDGFEIAADTAKESINTDNTDGNEKKDVQFKTNCDVENSTKAAHKHISEIHQLNKEDTDPSAANQPSLVTKVSENTQNKNSLEESKQNEENLSAGNCESEINNSGPFIKINSQIEGDNCAEYVECTSADMPQRDTNSQERSILIKESNTVEKESTENKIVGQTKSEDDFTTESTPIESGQQNLKEDKCDTNSQPQGNEIIDTQEVVQFGEHSKSQPNETTETKTETNSAIEKFIGSKECSQIVPVEVNKKTLVLVLDNEPKAVKVRRLTRANTEELEALFQALEKQLNDRGQQNICEKGTKSTSADISQNDMETSQAMSDLTKEIQALSKIESNKTDQNEKFTQATKEKQTEEFDWGSDPIKYHLKKRTVYLPSTKELEARFRSLERQIKILEDVEKIDVEQRLIEIERKIKLQYSLSHEKDLNKFLELCEGKDPDDLPLSLENHQEPRENYSEVQFDQKYSTKHTSPNRLKETTPLSSHIESRYRSLDLKRSKSKQSLKKQPIHPLEMLLDPSPDDSDIPTTGELEHRIRVMEETRCTPSPPSRKSRSVSPPIKQSKTKLNTHILEKLTASPTERELPTAEELEARLEALEKEQCFNFKMQKNFRQFNQKLKDVVSPSLSFDEIKSSMKSSDSGHTKIQTCSAPIEIKSVNTISPKTIRFCDKEQTLSQKEIEPMTVPETKGPEHAPIVREGLGVMGIRLMRETSPLRRKGTHTGVPLRTGENINDQLTSIQNTIKSIDSLCEEKPYRKERCQQYIDALFSDSTYFAHKKTSLEDLTSRNRSRSTSREIGPSIRISDHSPAISRSVGSADSIQSSSPLRPSSPLQYRSNRDLRRETSPRCRRDEDREEHESRVRRDNILPNINYSHSILSHTSHSSLTKFHKVDSQLIPNDVEHEHEESLRHPTFSTTDNVIYHDNINTSNDVSITKQCTLKAEVTSPDLLKSRSLDRPTLPLCQSILPNSYTPVYTPAKLEIRHTTVTSTFYDRVLTEKKLEKQHLNSSSTNNQSPMISPLFERPKTNLPTANNQITNKTFTYRYDKYVDSN